MGKENFAFRSNSLVFYQIDPLSDLRWRSFVERHEEASVFHSCEWLAALHQTYGFKPEVLTTSPPGLDLQDGIVYCRMKSWITGRRIISLPFSDHCEPLLKEASQLPMFINALEMDMKRSKSRYVEVRAIKCYEEESSCRSGDRYCLHRIDLTYSLEQLFNGLHRDSIRRKIRRAEREKLVYKDGCSRILLEKFWLLYVQTRKRHLAPPQPIEWFYNLLDVFGESIKIRIAEKGGRPVAGIITLQHKNILVYKYGASDVKFNNLGGVHLLFWKSIEEAKADKLAWFDLGRSEYSNTGLITFKDRWGAQRTELKYMRLPARLHKELCEGEKNDETQWKLARRLTAVLPNKLFCLIGAALYRHYS